MDATGHHSLELLICWFSVRLRAGSPSFARLRRASDGFAGDPAGFANGNNMADDKALKSSYQLAMERFKKSDQEAGIEHKPSTEAQKAAVAEIRSVYQAKLAQLEILHQGQMRQRLEHAERATLEDHYRRERERLSSERDAKIEKARGA